METLRQNLVDAINELNKLILATEDEEIERQIRWMRKLYVQLLEEVIKQEIASNTVEFQAAIEGLQAAKKAAVEAKEDIEKVAKAIERAVQAAKAVDKVVGLGIGLLA